MASMKLLSPSVFDPFPGVVAAISLKDADAPEGNNMSIQQGAPEVARSNRARFAQETGFEPKKLITPNQEHTAIVHLVRGEYSPHTADALISDEPGWLLGVTVADCVPLLLLDPRTCAYGVVHSGWRGSSQNITGNTVAKMTQEFGSSPNELIAWIGPGAGAHSYEVGYDVVSEFNPKYSTHQDDSWFFDNTSVVYDQLVGSGLIPEKIAVSSLDTITNPELHSARRDGDSSGRMLAAIGVSA